ncbi:hypothetical protein [Arcobacter vandammei]|uniref:hypothetical protein n=1 Tax=Arcobacter vandammei TaxID=2782243 RepID=UPI0018DF2698|nr:hypothetical protein [Arcobacter vandammei]
MSQENREFKWILNDNLKFNNLLSSTNISQFYTEIINKNAIEIVENNIEDNSFEENYDTEIEINNNENKSPIRKLHEYLTSPIREDSAEIIESMIELSGSLENMSVESIELSKLLNESERAKLNLLKEMGKKGLNTHQYPLGKSKKEQINPVAFSYEVDTKLNLRLKQFGILLEELATNNDLEFKKSVIEEKKELEELGIDIKKYVLNQLQKKGYFRTLTFEDERISRVELDFLLNFMNNSNFKNSKVIKEREEFYKSLLNDEKRTDFPDTSELIKDVAKLKGILNHKLEDLPAVLTQNDKENFKKFLPALDEYYKDQICALSGGKSFVPLAKNLKEIQKEINENPNAKSLLENCEILGYSQQRLYILHWVAESLMKKKYSTTLGKALINYSNENPNQRLKYKELSEAVRFRNDIAHNGLLWNPEEFEKYIKSYEDGIKFISEDLNINLDEYRLKKQDRNLTPAEIKEEVYKEITNQTNLKISTIDKIGIDFTKNQRMKTRLYDFANILKEKEISVQKLIDENTNIVSGIIKSKEDKVSYLINKEFNHNFFKDKFAKTYFNMEFDELIERASKVRTNVNKWLFKMAMMNKEDKLTSLEIEELKKFRDKLNAR